MRLNNIPRNADTGKSRKRLGRGRGSGHGKTSGRGHKGQKSRAGSSQRPGFESGHIPLYRRLPRRGFNNVNFHTQYSVVNVGDLARVEGGEIIDKNAMVKAGLVRKSAKLIKVLGFGNVEGALKVRPDKFSAAAAEKIKAAGGEALETAPAPEPAPAPEEE